MAVSTTGEMHWWQTGIVYQIYPRSFQDSNGDGVGDLQGIVQRLDYVQRLNVDAIWLSPIYPSPMHDFGYDVADYRAIDPLFGTMADFDRLLAEAHKRNLKVILDLVPNHTSDEHDWFQESRSSRDNTRRDWYIWRDPAPDSLPGNPQPPNNWLSYFGGPAWTYDEKTQQFYLHLFDTHQPDLNYRNPAVRQAMLDIMRFWLEKGIDGFRADVIWLMMKDEKFRDEPENPAWRPQDAPHARLEHIYTGDLPEVHDLIGQMRSVIDEYSEWGRERVFIGEIYLPIEKLVTYYGSSVQEVHLPFNFHLILLEEWNARRVEALVDEYEAALPEEGWPNWVLGNHDQHRIASRVGMRQARLAQMLLLTLRGTPTCYYGDEIGMRDVAIPPEKLRDPQALNQIEVADAWGRDPERTPMQWSAAANAGFAAAKVEPWLPLADDYRQCNVEVQEGDPVSMLHYFRSLTGLRRSEPALHAGDYAAVRPAEYAADIFSYVRAWESDRLLIVLNFGGRQHTLDFSHAGQSADLLLSTNYARSGPVDLSALALAGDEGLIVRLQ